MRLVLLLVLLVTPQALYACTCDLPDPSPKSSFKAAEVVFLGETIEYEGGIARVRPLEMFKGTMTPLVEFATAGEEAACGYGSRLLRGSRHLFYVHRDERAPGAGVVTTCGRSRPLERAECDLAYLRSRAAWWRSPFSSFRPARWLRIWWPACRNSV